VLGDITALGEPARPALRPLGRGRGDGTRRPAASNRAGGERKRGVRLSAAFSELLRASDDRAVIFGADCPHSGGASGGRAWALERADLALTLDGGCDHRPAPRDPRTVRRDSLEQLARLDSTRDRARSLGLETAILEPLDDRHFRRLCRLIAG
jgi:hypothetical protein